MQHKLKSALIEIYGYLNFMIILELPIDVSCNNQFGWF